MLSFGITGVLGLDRLSFARLDCWRDFSTDRPDKTETPFAVKLSDTWDVGMQTELDLNSNGNAGYNAGFVNTVSFGHKISDKWSNYFEIYTNTEALKQLESSEDESDEI